MFRMFPNKQMKLLGKAGDISFEQISDPEKARLEMRRALKKLAC
jgi:hypothetical protein